jgi:hypothetical protein
VTTGVLANVPTHASRAVCTDTRYERRTRPHAASRTIDQMRTAVAHAPPASRSTPLHVRGSRFQLHSRPPRQRLPSGLVIESASASASRCVSSSRAEALPMNASDLSLVPLERVCVKTRLAAGSRS